MKATKRKVWDNYLRENIINITIEEKDKEETKIEYYTEGYAVGISAAREQLEYTMMESENNIKDEDNININRKPGF